MQRFQWIPLIAAISCGAIGCGGGGGSGADVEGTYVEVESEQLKGLGDNAVVTLTLERFDDPEASKSHIEGATRGRWRRVVSDRDSGRELIVVEGEYTAFPTEEENRYRVQVRYTGDLTGRRRDYIFEMSGDKVTMLDEKREPEAVLRSQ